MFGGGVWGGEMYFVVSVVDECDLCEDENVDVDVNGEEQVEL